jgi:hypothetical protein
MEQEIIEKLEQPLTLAYLSCITLSMLDTNARLSPSPIEYVTKILDSSKNMMDSVVNEQISQYNEMIDNLDMGEHTDREATLIKMGIPTSKQFKVTMMSIVDGSTVKFNEYKKSILEEILNKDKHEKSENT